MAFNIATLQTLPTTPGIYRMLDASDEVLYVGKARNLRARVRSYFRPSRLSPKAQALTALIERIEITVTHTENEALLLENNLIKTLHPRFNVLLRDDKSYPYIFVADTQDFPRIGFHRGAKREQGRYFGPFPSASAVRESLIQLQKIFQVRQCEDSFFKNRSRPCLQYQIKRCSAPCVSRIDRERYREDVNHAIMFLEGRSRALTQNMVQKMEDASTRLDYEAAAQYRDRVAALKRIQERQYIVGESGNADVLAVAVGKGAACIELMFIRNGANLGSKSFFPNIGAESDPANILAAFLPQYYLGKPVPERLYANCAIADRSLLEQVFSEQADKKVSLIVPRRGAPKRWIKMAELNAREGLRRRLADHASLAERFDALRSALKLDATPERIECFDVSHTFGEATVAACVVFDANGPVKSDYRRFNIENVTPGDDYGALTQALTRRYRRVKEGEGKLPDLLFIDGGKGQMAVAGKALLELQVEGLRLVGVAKGRSRKPGREQLFLSGQTGPTILRADSPALHLIQQIRDEAHRFAIAGHRLRRGKTRTISALVRIRGVGDKRRQALLKNLGGLREVMRAGIEDLARVPGVSRGLAQRIYDVFHEREA